MIRVRLRLARTLAALSCVTACNPSHGAGDPLEPVNACPEHPCSAYAGDAAATCNGGGVCVEAFQAAPAHLIFIVDVPPTAVRTPGLPIALEFPGGIDAGEQVIMPWASDINQYVVTQNQAAEAVQGYLGPNPQTNVPLPAHVAYRPMWPSPSNGRLGGIIAVDGGVPLVDAPSLGLPLGPITGFTVQTPLGSPSAGPGMTPDVEFGVYLQPGVTYLRSISPDPPFNTTFPPAVSLAPFVQGSNVGATSNATFNVPTFTLRRADGRPLDGWSAYLRDIQTKEVFSPVKPLSGTSTPDGGLLLPTTNDPTSLAASLATAELVFVPPPGEAMPSEVFTSVTLGRNDFSYVFLPPPVTVRGTIRSSTGDSLPAQVVFEAQNIYAALPPVPTDPDDGGAGLDAGAADAGPTYQLFPMKDYFDDYDVTASATTLGDGGPCVAGDPSAGGCPYQVELPRGVYRIIVRPLAPAVAVDDAGAPVDAAAPDESAASAVTIFDQFDTTLGTAVDGGIPGMASPTSLVSGTALLADQRPLADATVEAIPLRCGPSPLAATGVTVADTASCLPRYVRTTTDAGGAFRMALDPGDYAVRVEPRDGTRLPWVFHNVTVPTDAPVTFTVPVPVERSLTLLAPTLDPSTFAPLSQAIVRIFTAPGRDPAIEVGRALTDSNGRFDVYLDPAVQ